MNRKRQCEYIVIGMAFTIYIAIISYQLTNASLWYDETVEYWHSKLLIGSLPFYDGCANMYERIVATYQPPLFNILMYFWLKIRDTEWWIRMFGVAMGMIGAIGTYKTMFFGTGCRIKASIAIILYATIFRLTYYWQEVAEYSLMLGLLSWTVYFFLQAVNKPTTKRIILFVIFCVLPVYSQYGAVFLVVAFGIMMFVKIMKDNDKENIKTLLASYVVAVLFAAIPLYWFFLRPQMIRQGSNDLSLSNSFSLNSLYDSFMTVFKFNFVANDLGRTGEHVLTAVVLLMIVFSVYYILKGKISWMRYLLISNVICYGLYYFAVFIGAYSYGSFGARYNLFFIPVWFVTGLLLIFYLLSALSEIRLIKYSSEVAAVLGGIAIAGLFCWSYIGWINISDNWSKEDIRGATSKWLSVSGYDTATIVYYGANSGFSYYVVHSNEYASDIFENVTFQQWDADQTTEHYKDWVDSVYEEWPTSLYIIASHYKTDVNELTSVFTEAGYEYSRIYYNEGGLLVYLELTEQEVYE